MSLLMDALRRAEQNKNKDASAATASTEPPGAIESPTAPAKEPLDLTLEPAESSKNRLPDLDLEAVDADLEAEAEASRNPPFVSTAAPTEAPAATKETERQSAQRLFAAKTTIPPESPPQAKRLYVLIGVGVLALGGVAAYFAWQLNAIGHHKGLAAPSLGDVKSIAPPAPPHSRPLPIAEAPRETAAPVALPTESTIEQPQSSPQEASPAPKPPQTSKSASAKPRNPASSTAERPLSPKTNRPASKKPPPESAPVAEPLAIARAVSTPPLQRGYQALSEGRMHDARTAYALALDNDPNSVDALLGLATVARSSSQLLQAEQYYQRALDLAPRNAAALTGLLSLRGVGDPAQTESRLKSLLALQNQEPAATGLLHFTLGNLLAAQRRWPEAQQHYFEAYRMVPHNPDYQYNLAVSLDQLNQAAAAKPYYAGALRAARNAPASFDIAQGERRLAELTSAASAGQAPR